MTGQEARLALARIVVTGHLGFVGRHLLERLVGAEVIGMDIKDGNDIINCDLPDADKVFHLAAQTNAQSDDVEEDALTNVIGSVRVFERYRDKVVFASSSMVNYPVSPYAISKAAGEAYARMFGAAIVRFCNLYGPGGHSVIDKFQAAERLTIFGSGEQVRTFASVGEALDALLSAEPGKTKILDGVDYSVNDVAKMFPSKPIDRLPIGRLDLMDARQIAGG